MPKLDYLFFHTPCTENRQKWNHPTLKAMQDPEKRNNEKKAITRHCI